MIENQKFDWSFGSGSEGRTHRHSGNTMMASGRIGTTAGNTAIPFEATVNVVVNGTEKEGYSVTISHNRHSAARRFSTPLELFPDDRINVRSASGNPDVTSAVVSLLIQLDM